MYTIEGISIYTNPEIQEMCCEKRVSEHHKLTFIVFKTMDKKHPKRFRVVDYLNRLNEHEYGCEDGQLCDFCQWREDGNEYVCDDSRCTVCALVTNKGTVGPIIRDNK